MTNCRRLSLSRRRYPPSLGIRHSFVIRHWAFVICVQRYPLSSAVVPGGPLLQSRFRAAPKRRTLQVGQATPQPFCGPEAEEAQPQGADNELEDPNTEYDADLPDTLNPPTEAQALTIKD